jgi:hypothetical protein
MPDEDGHVTHFTVPALPWKDPGERVVGRVVPDDVVGAIRAAGQATWPPMTQEMLDDCLIQGSIIRRALQEMVARVDRAALDNMLDRVTPENVHPEYNPAYECEDCETDECEED